MKCKREIILLVMIDGWKYCDARCRHLNHGRCNIFGSLKLGQAFDAYKRHSSCKHAQIKFNKLNKERDETMEGYDEME